MEINNRYIYRKNGDAYYFISINGGGFKLQNKTGCLMLEEILKAGSLEQAKETFLLAVPEGNKAAAAVDFDKVAGLCRDKYGIFAGSKPLPGAEYGESELLQELYAKESEPSRVTKCHIELTNYCNFKCRMCYMGSITEKDSPRAIKTAEFGKMLGLLEKDGLIELTLTGGEPLLDPDAPGILSMLRKKNILVAINTNGSVLTEAILEALQGVRVSSVEISIYGFSEETYEKITGRRDFRKVLGNVDKIIAAGLPLRLKYTLQKDNLADVRAFKAYCLEKGVRHFITRGELMPDVAGSQTSARSLSPEEIETLCLDGIMDIPDPKTKTSCEGTVCKPARSRLAIDAHGNVFPCENIRLHLGNILGERAGEVIGEKNNRLALIRKVPAEDSPECAGCEVKAFCSTKTCPAAQYAVHGRLAGLYEPSCRQAKLFHRIRIKKNENSK